MPLIVESVEEEIMKEVSADFSMPYGMIKDIIINGQSAFTKHVMESGGYNSVRWPRLGTFKLKTKYMLIRKHMEGINQVQKRVFKKKIKEGLVFTKEMK